MKSLLIACLVTVVLAESYEPIGLDYHDNFGIKEAARIKAAEEAQDFSGSRIIGGSTAPLGVHPHYGGLLITLQSGATSVCGSSLVSNTRAVTAAHCWRHGNTNARQLVVVLGSTTLFSGGTRVTTTNVQVHQNYNPNNLNNDVAIIIHGWVGYNNYKTPVARTNLLQFASVTMAIGILNGVSRVIDIFKCSLAEFERVTLKFLSDNIVRNINLPTGSLGNQNFAGVWATAAGFGRTSETAGIGTNQLLRHVNLQVITNALCQQTYGPNTVISSTLCTASTSNANVCSGDSGGPLAVSSGGQLFLVGITSFVAAAGCQRGLPAGFARATSFTPWIQARL